MKTAFFIPSASRVRKTAILTLLALAFAQTARADVCDYTLSRVMGPAAAALSAAVNEADGVAAVGAQAAGYYTLAHGGSGLSALGAVALGGSTSGATGLIAGAGSAIGTVLTAPVTLIVGGITIVGIGSLEGFCYFQVDRITDPAEVRHIITSMALADDAVSIVSTHDGDAMALIQDGRMTTYLLRNLYIADGSLKHRDRLRNTNLGPVYYTTQNIDE